MKRTKEIILELERLMRLLSDIMNRELELSDENKSFNPVHGNYIRSILNAVRIQQINLKSLIMFYNSYIERGGVIKDDKTTNV